MTRRGESSLLTAVVAIADADGRARRSEALGARGFAVVAQVGDADAAVAAVVSERPDLCLVGVDLTDDALGAIAQMATRAPATTIVALARATDPGQMIQALERGASGYLSADIRDDELATSLRAAVAGEPALARSLVPYLIEHVRSGGSRQLALPDGSVTMTLRESHVAELVVAGLSTDEIAKRLGLSPVTVRRHISSLVRKSGAGDRAGLVQTLKDLQGA